MSEFKPHERMWTTKQVAEYLQVHKRTVDRMRQDGRLRFCRLHEPDGAVRFPVAWNPILATSDPTSKSQKSREPSDAEIEQEVAEAAATRAFLRQQRRERKRSERYGRKSS